MTYETEQSIRSMLRKGFDLHEGQEERIVRRLNKLANGGEPLDWMWLEETKGLRRIYDRTTERL